MKRLVRDVRTSVINASGRRHCLLMNRQVIETFFNKNANNAVRIKDEVGARRILVTHDCQQRICVRRYARSCGVCASRTALGGNVESMRNTCLLTLPLTMTTAPSRQQLLTLYRQLLGVARSFVRRD